MSESFRKIIATFGIVLCLAFVAQSQNNDQASDALITRLDYPDCVKDVAFSPDGKLLAAGYGWNIQGGVRIWNVADQVVHQRSLARNGQSGRKAKSPFSRAFREEKSNPSM